MVVRTHAQEHLAGTAVLADVHQGLLNDSSQFPAYPLLHVKLINLRDEAGADAGLALKSLDRVFHETKEVGRIDVEGLHLLHQFPQLEDFLTQEALDSSEFCGDRARIDSRLPANHVHLHLHRDQRLHSAIVKLAGHSSALHRAGTLPQATQQVDVINGRSYLPHQFLQEAQLFFAVATERRIKKKNSPPPFLREDEGHRQKGIKFIEFAERS